MAAPRAAPPRRPPAPRRPRLPLPLLLLLLLLLLLPPAPSAGERGRLFGAAADRAPGRESRHEGRTCGRTFSPGRSDLREKGSGGGRGGAWERAPRPGCWGRQGYAEDGARGGSRTWGQTRPQTEGQGARQSGS